MAACHRVWAWITKTEQRMILILERRIVDASLLFFGCLELYKPSIKSTIGTSFLFS